MIDRPIAPTPAHKMTTLLTDAEVAERLRCTAAKVKRLRLSGKLTYLPGRPPLIDEVDLESYLATAKRRAREEPPPPAAAPEIDVEAIRARARRKALRRRMRSRLR